MDIISVDLLCISCTIYIVYIIYRGCIIRNEKVKILYSEIEARNNTLPKVDFHLIDNGEFWPSLLSKRKAIVTVAKEARLYEGKRDLEDAYDRWYEASDLIDQFESEYFESPKIQWARKKGFFHRFWKIIVAVIVGVIGSVIVQYLLPGLLSFFRGK